MANLPENINYGSSGTQPPNANLSNITKNIQSSIKNSTNKSSNTVNSAISSFFNQGNKTPLSINNFNQNAATSIFGEKPTSANTAGSAGVFPYGTPIGPQTPAGTTPPDYERFLAPTSNNGWVLPSGADPNSVQEWPANEQGNPGEKYITTPTGTSAVLKNYPLSLGGGQYVVDPTQPGKMIKSGRVAMNDVLNPGGRLSTLGGLDPRMFQIDHIIPLMLGGADTIGNLEIYSTSQNAEKQRIQAVPMALLSAHKINLAEARAMAFNWKNLDGNGLPSATDVANKYAGTVPLDVAIKQAQKWKDDLGKVDTAKYFGEAFKETMSNFGKNIPILGEFAKGLVGGGTAGIIPGTEASTESGTTGAISNFAGNLLGSLTGIGLLGKGLGALGLLGKGIKAESLANPFLKYSGTGIKSLDKLMGSTKVVSEIQKTAAITADAMKEVGLTTDLGDMSKVSSKVWAEKIPKMASSALVLGVWGQLGLFGRELTGQEQADLSNHLKTAASDIAYGGILGSASQTAKGYAGVALWSTALPLMEGQSIVPALQNGILMTALHGLGYEKGLIDPKLRIGYDEANKMAESTFNDYNGNLFPSRIKGQIALETLVYDAPQLAKIDQARIDFQKKYPDNPVSKHMGPITNTNEAVYFGEQLARQKFDNMVTAGDGTISQEQIEKEIQRITVAANQLKNQTLSPSERAVKEMKDLYSMGDKLRPQIKGSQFKGNEYKLATDSNEVFKGTDFNSLHLNEPASNPQDLKFSNIGEGTVVGYGGQLGAEEKRVVNDLAANPTKYKPFVVGVRDEKTNSIMRYIKHAQETNPKDNPGSQITTPDDTIRTFALEITPDGLIPRPVGYLPQTESYTKKNNVNKTYDEITNRLQHIFKTGNSPEEFQRMFNADKSMQAVKKKGVLIPASPIDLPTAQQLFDIKKKNAGSIPDKDLYSILKPSNSHEKFNSDLNNSNFSREMEKHGTNFVILSMDKNWLTGGRETAGEPRKNPDNPFIQISANNDTWLKTLETNDKSLSPLQKEIRQIMNRQKTLQLSGAVNKVIKKASNVSTPIEKEPFDSETGGFIKIPKDDIEQNETPLGEPVTASNLPQETSKTVETMKMPFGEVTAPKEEINIKGETTPQNDDVMKESPKGFETSKPVTSTDIRSELDGVNKAAIKTVEKKLNTLNPESPEAQDLIKFRDSFTKEKINAGAVDSFKTSGGDEAKGAELFTKRISDAFTSRGLEDPTEGYENGQAYKKVFRDAVLDKPSLTFKANDQGQLEIGYSNVKQPPSFVERTLGLKQVYFEDNKDLSYKDRPDEEAKKNFLLKKGYVPFYYDNKPGSLLGIEFDSNLAGGKKITDRGALDEFTNSIAKKLGFSVGENTHDSYNSFIKRLKSLNSQEQVSPIKGETWKTYIIKNDAGINKTVKETTPNWDKIKVNNVVADKEKVLEDLGKKMSTDGTMYTSPENIKRMAEGAGFIHQPTWLKPTQSFIDPETGNLFHQKLEMRAWTPEEKNQFEQGLGRKLTPKDLITFEDNVKMGYGKVGEDQGTHFEVNSPSDSISFKYNEPHEVGGSISLGGIMTKIPAESGLGKIIGDHYKTYADNLKKLSSEIQNSSGAPDIEAIWKKYPEFYKDHWMDNLYGELKKSAEHGAGLTQLGQTLNKEINKIIKEDYLAGSFMNGDNLHIKPDWGVKTDPKTGEKTYLNSGELMISKKTFTNLYGKDAYNELKNGTDFHVLTYRYPTLKDTSVAKMKVLIAEDNGQKIGNSQVVTNSADTMKFDHDTDGDTIQMFAIGGEKGVPREMADYFDKKAKEGNMIFPSLEKTAKMPFDGKNSYSKIMNASEQTLKGGEAIGIAASSARPMRFLKSNDFKIEVGPGTKDGSGDRTVNFSLNGKVYKTEKVPETVKGKKQFEKSPKEAFTVKPTFSDEESYLLGQIGQEAVDSVGTTDLVKRFSGNGGDASNYITENLFSNAEDKVVKNLIRKTTNEFQVPYKLENDSITKIQPYLESLKKIKENGGKLGPVEEIMLNLDGLKKIDYYYEDTAAQKSINAAASQNVANTFSNQASLPPSQTLKKWVGLVDQIKKENPKTRERKKLVTEEWKKFKKNNKISPSEKQEIALWASLSPSANLAYGQYTVRPTFLINESPDVAKSYFAGENTFKKEPSKKPDGQGGLLSDTWGSVKDLLGMGSPAISNIAKPPQTLSLDTKKFLNAIAANETSVIKGNKYVSSQKSGMPSLGKALGKYRVTEGELKTYSPRYLGKPVTSKEFNASPALQDTYMTNKALYLNKQGFTPQQIADIHNKGIKNASVPGSNQYQNPDYVNKFNLNYNSITPQS